MLFVLNEHNSVANNFLAELREVQTQQDRMRFRKNMERLGEIMAYEISKKLNYTSRVVKTPLGESTISITEKDILLFTVLRAGVPFFQGFLNYFDKADCGFIGAYRQEGSNRLTIKLDYITTPVLDNKTIILIDPMLATGRSILDSVRILLQYGQPKHIHLASLVSAPEGIQYLRDNLKQPYSLWTCAVDEKLNDNYYIVPGLGDAGDLSYGEKI